MRKSNPTRGKAAAKGFTLVELLVALVIVSVLVGILFGSMGKARNQADLSRCSNNLRQLQMAFTSFVSDNNGVLPDKSPRHLSRYIGITDEDIYRDSAYTCPALQRTENAAASPYNRSIAINIYATTEKITEPDRFTRILTPSKMILFTEGKIISDSVTPSGRRGKTYFSTTRLEDLDKLLRPHGNLQNAAFVDGSVRKVDDEEFYQGGRWNTFFWRGYEK